MNRTLKIVIVSAAAGAVTGAVGTGGGLILVPALTFFKCCKRVEVLPYSLSIMLPICIVSILSAFVSNPIPIASILPYCFGGIIGSIISIFAGKRIPVQLLHRLFAVFAIWGGIRFVL